jgi:ATP-dependent Clp protease ATP-binding subunit ClpA
MARVLQEHVNRPHAEELLFGRLANGGSVRVTLAKEGDGLALDVRPAKAPELLGQE